ncbi:putative lipoate-protein ligase A [Yarrowia sp. C11]|nr:putative lipoate-protein ligase A [Yarrowia sp. E02]KAG5373174.1 putative lipoate-protein ligase A [Yarrowia sp. C11]
MIRRIQTLRAIKQPQIHYAKRHNSTLTLESLAQQPGPQIFVSAFSDPFLNLALEEFLYNHMPSRDPKKTEPQTDPDALSNNRLVIYVNSPCVVIGRNQNPWREANIPVLESLRIPMIRRKSGGGTVVHDLGNVNYCFMTNNKDFSREKHSEMIKEGVNAVGNVSGGPNVTLKLNSRFDIVDISDNKVSGSAYKIQRLKAFHHGTMLLNSRLDVLKALLHRGENLGVIEGNGTASVKSPVTNIGMDKNLFIETVIKGFSGLYGVDFEDGSEPFVQLNVIQQSDLPQEVYETAEEMKTYQWAYGQTPKFTHVIKNDDLDTEVEFYVEKGILKDVKADPDHLDQFKYLKSVAQNEGVQYIGAKIAAFVTDEKLGDWIAATIDGSGKEEEETVLVGKKEKSLKDMLG